MDNDTNPLQFQELLFLMEMNLPNPEAVLANKTFPKGSPRPTLSRILHRSRHRQAGWKNFKADTFDADSAHESQTFFQIRFPLPVRVTYTLPS